MIRPLDVDELERQVDAAIAYPPNPKVEATFRAAGKPLPLENLYEILDREIIHRQARHPDDADALKRLCQLQRAIQQAFSRS